MSATDFFKTLQKFDAGHGRQGLLHSLPALEESGVGPISRLPISIRIVLESVLRNCDGKKVAEKDVRTLANWNAENAGEGGNSVRGRAHRFAGFHRRSAARGSRRDALARSRGWDEIRK